MQNYNDIISFINVIKENIKNHTYSDRATLEKDIYAVNDLLWKDIDDLYRSDLTNLCSVHEFLIDSICKAHIAENDASTEEIFGSNLNIKAINSHIQDAKRASNIYMFNSCDLDYYIIGDLHSDEISLRRIIAKTNFFDSIINGRKTRLVFLGDYVDRGKAHLRLLESILILKYIFPENIYLLRGNHDGATVNNGQVQLPVRRSEDDNIEAYFLLYTDNLSKVNSTFAPQMLYKYLEFFESLCNLAFINHKALSLLAVHGGIPRPRKDASGFYDYISCISDLTNTNIVDCINRTIVHNMMWSDPRNDRDNLREESARFGFTAEHFDNFRKVIGFDMLIRGHEAEEDGYKKYFDDKLFTIFSSGRILDNNKNINNQTAYEYITPKIFYLNKDGKFEIITID